MNMCLTSLAAPHRHLLSSLVRSAAGHSIGASAAPYLPDGVRLRLRRSWPPTGQALWTAHRSTHYLEEAAAQPQDQMDRALLRRPTTGAARRMHTHTHTQTRRQSGSGRGGESDGHAYAERAKGEPHAAQRAVAAAARASEHAPPQCCSHQSSCGRPAAFAKDEPLLLGRDALLVLDLRLDVGDRIALLHVHRHRLARQRFDEDLAVAAAEPQPLLKLSARGSSRLLSPGAAAASATARWRHARASHPPHAGRAADAAHPAS